MQEAAAPWRSTLSPPVCGFLTIFWLFSLKLECDKLASEKSEMQRHYVMVRTGPGSRARVGGAGGIPAVSRCLCLGFAWQGAFAPWSSRSPGKAGTGFSESGAFLYFVFSACRWLLKCGEVAESCWT